MNFISANALLHRCASYHPSSILSREFRFVVVINVGIGIEVVCSPLFIEFLHHLAILNRLCRFTPLARLGHHWTAGALVVNHPLMLPSHFVRIR